MTSPVSSGSVAHVAPAMLPLDLGGQYIHRGTEDASPQSGEVLEPRGHGETSLGNLAQYSVGQPGKLHVSQNDAQRRGREKWGR